MKSWNEVEEGDIVYVRDEIEVYNDNEIVIGKTKPFQKAYVNFNDDNKVICIIIDGGKFDGEDFYFGESYDSSPEELLTAKEYKLLKNTEIKTWKDLKKFINIIDALSEKSEDILKVKELIEKHNS
jgi:carbamoylphosphate synthase large subunit